MTDDELRQSLDRIIKNARMQGFCWACLLVLTGYFIADVIKHFS